MNNTAKAMVIGILGVSVLGVYDKSQELRADLWGRITDTATVTAKAVPVKAPTTAPVETKVVPTASGLISATKSLTAPTTAPVTDAMAAQTAAVGQVAAVGDASAQAKTSMDQAIAYIKTNRLDLAETVVSQLEASKASLPVPLQGRVVDLRTMLDTAKAAAVTGLALPSFGK